MAIEETIVLKDKVSSAADEAAAAVNGLDTALKEAKGNAAKLGDASKKASEAAMKATKKEWREDSFRKKQLQETLDPIGEMKEGLLQISPAGVAAAAGIALIAVAAFKAVTALKDIAVATLEAAGSARIARDGYTAMLDQLTAGRGAEALKHLDTLSQKLGISVEDAVSQFTKLRKEGLSNIDSSSLIKLRADLLAVGVSADEADSQIKEATKAIKEGKSASAVIKDIADNYGAVGDGANAAAAQQYTLGGAIQNVKNLANELWAGVADGSKEAFGSAAAAVGDWITSFRESGKLQKLIDGISGAVKVMLAGFEGFISVIQPGIDALMGAFEELGTAIGGAEGGMNGARSAGEVLGAAIGFVAQIIAFMIGQVTMAINAWNAMKGAATAVSSAISGAYEAVKGFVSKFFQAGVDLVTGFIDGIKSMVTGAIDSAKNLGKEAGDALKNALGIGSPSKVAMGIAQNFGGTFSDSMAEAIPSNIIDTAVAPANDISPIAAAPSSPVTVNVYVTNSNATASDIESAVLRGVERALRMRAA